MYTRAYVEITNICNMHCSFCHGHRRPPRRMSREEFSAVLDQLTGLTQYVYYHLMGEPLTHPELPAFLNLASSRGFRSVITSNGTLLPKYGDALIAAMPHKVNISVHSFERDDEVGCRQYLDQVVDFGRKASEAGILVSLRLWNRGADGGRNETVLDYLHSCIPEPWVGNTKGFRLLPRFFLEWGDRFAWPDSEAPVQGSQFFCYGLRDHFGILCDGTVVPCCLDSDGCIALGNLFEQPLSQILSSPRARAMVDGFSRRAASEDLCRRCGYAQRFV